ncbi:flotillin-like FloA family protein [Fibrobacter succinogenes]|uniref:flotillin-like FloA family protein n=1 Tax=Fibrobacter succinogenes TaxID=833 RepID=UPI001567BD43|nr:flotillin-like FloA family protein [Fibrobacter succinogenes]
MEVLYINRIVIVAIVFIITVIGLFFLQVLFQWIKALHSNVNVSYSRLVSMRLRKVPVQTIIEAYVLGRSEGYPIELDLLEAHYLAGGNVLRTVQAVIAANKANVKLDFKEAAALDLAGDGMLEVAKNIAKNKPFNGII